MHVDSLKYLVDVVKEKSISKAAKKAHITQSALSQLIQKIEEDFGYQLLTRSNKGVEVTQMGEIAIKYANNILDNYDKMFEELETTKSKTNKIYINATWSLVAYSLPCVIYKMKKKYPNHNYELVASTDEKTVIQVENDICNIGFVETEISQDLGLFSYKIGTERIVLIAPARFNIPEKIQIQDLLNIEIIMCTENTRVCKILDENLNKYDKSVKDLKTIFNVDSVSAVKSSVTNGFGMAFVPYKAIKHELYEKKVKIVEIEGVVLDYDIFLVCKKLKNLSKESREAIDYLIENGKKSFC